MSENVNRDIQKAIHDAKNYDIKKQKTSELFLD